MQMPMALLKYVKGRVEITRTQYKTLEALRDQKNALVCPSLIQCRYSKKIQISRLFNLIFETYAPFSVPEVRVQSVI